MIKVCKVCEVCEEGRVRFKATYLNLDRKGEEALCIIDDCITNNSIINGIDCSSYDIYNSVCNTCKNGIGLIVPYKKYNTKSIDDIVNDVLSSNFGEKFLCKSEELSIKFAKESTVLIGDPDIIETICLLLNSHKTLYAKFTTMEEFNHILDTGWYNKTIEILNYNLKISISSYWNDEFNKGRNPFGFVTNDESIWTKDNIEKFINITPDIGQTLESAIKEKVVDKYIELVDEKGYKPEEIIPKGITLYFDIQFSGNTYKWIRLEHVMENQLPRVFDNIMRSIYNSGNEGISKYILALYGKYIP